jgi:hypothetical protein
MMEGNLDRRAAVLGACLLPMAGCAALSTDIDAAGRMVATVSTDPASAANLYAIAKGIGQVALLALAATPEGAAITAAITIGDAVVASMATVSPSAPTAAASTLLTSANAILLAGAPAIKAVSNAT